MKIPFTYNEFLGVFERYNQDVWPSQLILFALAVVALVAIYRNDTRGRQVLFAVLSLLWAWMGLVYHITYFSAINKAAYGFGLLFLIQSFVFVYAGIIRDKLSFDIRFDVYTIIGMTFVAYALVGYPLVGILLGHTYPKSPTFGVPCPTTIFTFGVLMCSSQRISVFVLLIPFLWSIVGFSAAFHLAIYEDIGLILSGIVSTVVLTALKKRPVNVVAQ
jgi:hypothetical protein